MVHCHGKETLPIIVLHRHILLASRDPVIARPSHVYFTLSTRAKVTSQLDPNCFYIHHFNSFDQMSYIVEPSVAQNTSAKTSRSAHHHSGRCIMPLYRSLCPIFRTDRRDRGTSRSPRRQNLADDVRHLFRRH